MSEAVEFGQKSIADSYQDDHPDWIWPVDDDARTKTVHFKSDTPDRVLEQARRESIVSRAEKENKTGQVSLTDDERSWIDFYDPTLTVEEHHSVAERAEGDRRLDNETSELQRQADAVRAAQSGECDHARGHFENGDPEACEFLQERCGYDEEEVSRILEGPEDDVDVQDELPGQAKGALKRSWGGYNGAVESLEELVDELREEWGNAQQAAKAINGVRTSHGQESIHFDRLEEIQADISDLVRTMAADCHECHADHTGHDHPTEANAREDLEDLAGETTT